MGVQAAMSGSGPPSDAADPLMASRLVVCGNLALESRDGTHVVVFDKVSAARTKLSLAAYRFLKSFESPRRLDQIVADASPARLVPLVRMLIDRRMLVDADAPPSPEAVRRRTAVAYKFCNAPAYVRSAKPDFVILGVPYDLAGGIDSRLAPDLIRRKSLEHSYQAELAGARTRGWFDADRGIRMLGGATFADAGDVPVEYGESRDRYFERAAEALAECCTGDTVPVILGGDRSATRATVGGPGREDPVTVVQITADPDRAADEGAGRRLSRIDKVERVISLAPHALRSGGAEDIVRSWGDGLPIHLSIDLAIVPEVFMAARADPEPEPTLAELKAAIAAAGRLHRIVGIDLVGLDFGSSSPGLTAIVGIHLALAAMSAAYDRC